MKVRNWNARKAISMLLGVSIALLSCVSAIAKEYPQKFWDVPKEHWAYNYIADLADRGVINGYEDGSFKPERTVTRAEWSKIMVDAAGVSGNDDAIYFTDMQGHWANKHVNAAKNYLTGYTDGSFRPEQAAVREDVTVAMVRLKGYDLSEVDYSYLSAFKDVDSISNYAKGYVAVAVQNNLISGFEDKTFRGQATLTRAEAATLLYRAFQHGSADKLVTIPTEPIDTTSSVTLPVTSNGDIQQSEAETSTDMSKNDEPKKTEKRYVMDTIVDTSDIVRSMVVDNNGTVHYLDKEQSLGIHGSKLEKTYGVCNTKGEFIDPTKDLKFDIGYDDKNYDYTVQTACLAYDPYNDIVYLIGDGESGLIIFDITDYENPKMVLSSFNCDFDFSERMVSLEPESNIEPPVLVLENGSLVIETLKTISSNTTMVNIKNRSLSRFGGKKNIPDSIEGGLPYENGNNTVYADDGIYFWNDDEGYVYIDPDGYRHVLVAVNDIEALDYKPTNGLNIWNAVVDAEKSFIFYDNSCKCIRILKKLEE